MDVWVVPQHTSYPCARKPGKLLWQVSDRWWIWYISCTFLTFRGAEKPNSSATLTNILWWVSFRSGIAGGGSFQAESQHTKSTTMLYSVCTIPTPAWPYNQAACQTGAQDRELRVCRDGWDATWNLGISHSFDTWFSHASSANYPGTLWYYWLFQRAFLMSILFVCVQECLHVNVNTNSGYGYWNFSGV